MSVELNNSINTKQELADYLKLIKDKFTSGEAAAVQVLTALNNVLSSGNIYEILDDANKQIAQELWLSLQSKGIKLKNPPILFTEA